jgi:hypothetical protein
VTLELGGGHLLLGEDRERVALLVRWKLEGVLDEHDRCLDANATCLERFAQDGGCFARNAEMTEDVGVALPTHAVRDLIDRASFLLQPEADVCALHVGERVAVLVLLMARSQASSLSRLRKMRTSACSALINSTAARRR